MLITNKNMMLRVGGKIILPGEKLDLPDATAMKLLQAGLVSATVQPEENAMMPKPRHVGGGYYELPDGKRVRGKKAAEEALRGK